MIGPGILITPRMSNSKASVFPPALSRQFAMAAARSSDQGVDQVRPDDSASGVGSQASWSVVPPDAPGTPVQPAQSPEAPPGIDKTVWDQDSDDDVPPANWSAYAAFVGSATHMVQARAVLESIRSE